MSFVHIHYKMLCFGLKVVCFTKLPCEDDMAKHDLTPSDKEVSGIEQAVINSKLTQEEFARVLGVTQQAVSSWIKRGYAPAARAVEIESLYGVPRANLLSPKLRSLVGVVQEFEGSETAGA